MNGRLGLLYYHRDELATLLTAKMTFSSQLSNKQCLVCLRHATTSLNVRENAGSTKKSCRRLCVHVWAFVWARGFEISVACKATVTPDRTIS